MTRTVVLAAFVAFALPATAQPSPPSSEYVVVAEVDADGVEMVLSESLVGALVATVLQDPAGTQILDTRLDDRGSSYRLVADVATRPGRPESGSTRLFVPLKVLEYEDKQLLIAERPWGYSRR
ncbi:MAG: hypothetical protein AAGI52_18840 [Bacteroidota bacterium]